MQDNFLGFQRPALWLQIGIGQRIDHKIANSPRGFMAMGHTQAGINTAGRRTRRRDTDLEQTKLFPI
jgi:hypothetical protein